MKIILALLLFIVSFSKDFSQNIGINNTGLPPDPSAQLDVSATDKEILIPRITSAKRTAITTPATGLLVYQTDAQNGFWYFDGPYLETNDNIIFRRDKLSLLCKYKPGNKKIFNLKNQ